MNRAKLVAAIVVVGCAVALGLFAYLLDQGRAYGRVIPGLGDAAGPERGRELEVVASEEGGADEFESARRAPPLRDEPDELVVRVADDEGSGASLDVLVYRGEHLLRAAHATFGNASLIPFEGPGSVRVEHDSIEIARLEIPEGRGRYEVRVPRLASVAGVVRVGGVPRADIHLRLTDEDAGGLADWIATALRSAHLRWGPSGFSETHSSTKADGTFRYEGLVPNWSGALVLAAPENHRLVNGATRIELARPEEGLVLDVEALRPERELRGRAVFAGEGVPGASWSRDGDPSGECDEHGRFSFHVFEDELDGSHLALSKPGLGKRKIELRGIETDLGDVELLPTRTVRFVVRSESGAPIAGARAALRSHADPSKLLPPSLHWFVRSWRSGEPGDPAGECALDFLAADEREFRIGARGYGAVDVLVPEPASEAVPVVLPRCAAVLVVLRDRAGRAPRGLRVLLQAAGPPFTYDDGYQPAHDELVHGGSAISWRRVGDGMTGEYAPDARGRAWIDRLRGGVPFALSVVDAFGTVVVPARELVLAEGEWRRIELAAEVEPRRLLLVVRDTLDRPLERAWLKIPSVESRSRLYTDRAGMARSELLYRGEVTFRVGREGFEARLFEDITIPREGATIEVRLAHDWWPW